MWLLILEAALALALLIFIVWWTMAPVKRRENAEQARQGRERAQKVDGTRPSDDER